MPRRTVNQRIKTPRSESGGSPEVRAKMDRFVEGLLMGLGSTQAAVYAGLSSRSAARQGAKWRCDPYVRERFTKLREKLTKDEICSFAELALNVKSIAFDEYTTAKQVRVIASALLARIMGHEAPAKFAGTVNGGCLLIPVAGSQASWEQQAIAAQAQLQREVEQDANL
jgi:hypothetical protein